jgi:hypothetical protein
MVLTFRRRSCDTSDPKQFFSASTSLSCTTRIGDPLSASSLLCGVQALSNKMIIISVIIIEPVSHVKSLRC